MRSQSCDFQHASFWLLLHITKLTTDLGFKGLRDSLQWQCLHSGVCMAGLCMEAQASINQPSTRQPPAIRTNHCSDWLSEKLYIFGPTPCPFTPPPDDQQGLAGCSWNVLANITKDPPLPEAAQTPNNLTRFAEGQLKQSARKKQPKKKPLKARGQYWSMWLS